LFKAFAYGFIAALQPAQSGSDRESVGLVLLSASLNVDGLIFFVEAFFISNKPSTFTLMQHEEISSS
jgi:hypothetical protein